MEKATELRVCQRQVLEPLAKRSMTELRLAHPVLRTWLLCSKGLQSNHCSLRMQCSHDLCFQSWGKQDHPFSPTWWLLDSTFLQSGRRGCQPLIAQHRSDPTLRALSKDDRSSSNAMLLPFLLSILYVLNSPQSCPVYRPSQLPLR